MAKNLKHVRTCVYNCNYYLVFSTKYRKPVLTEEIEKRFKELVEEIGKEKGFEIYQVKDHVHIFVSFHHIRRYVFSYPQRYTLCVAQNITEISMQD
ncbi:MAG: IS200/IS605 family transposase [candidate division WOR-3 bacterium]